MKEDNKGKKMEDQTDPRQYYCPKCETLTIIKDEQRSCQCDDIMSSESWKEVFLDRIKE